MMPSLQQSGHSTANAVAIKSDDRILVAGTVNQAEFSLIGDRIGLVRLNNDGSEDKSFGPVGIGWAAPFCTCATWGLAVPADGSIVVAGQSRDETQGFQMFGWRYTSTGKVLQATLEPISSDMTMSPATSCSSRGRWSWSGGPLRRGAGSSTTEPVHFSPLARFNNVPEGVDESFAPGGKLTAGFGFGYDAAWPRSSRRTVRYVAAGGSNQSPPQGQYRHGLRVRAVTGAKSGFPGFKAEVYHLKDFTLKAAPDKFRVFWRVEGEPTVDGVPQK